MIIFDCVPTALRTWLMMNASPLRSAPKHRFDGKLHSLIDAALKAGARDNITVVLLGRSYTPRIP